MKKYFLIFFFHVGSYAISVSQLEQLQIARKNIAMALNQYSDVIHMKQSEIYAWKKDIESNFAVIEKFDPDEALKLKEAMIDPTFAALEKLQQQKVALKNADFQIRSHIAIKQPEKKVNQAKPATTSLPLNNESINVTKTEEKSNFSPQQEIIVKPVQPKKVIIAPPVKGNKDQSAHEGEAKNIKDIQSKEVDISEIEVVKPIESSLVEKEASIISEQPKKVIAVPPVKGNKDQSAHEGEAKNIKDIQSKEVDISEIEVVKPIESSLVEKEASIISEQPKKVIAVPPVKGNKDQSAHEGEAKNIKDIQSKEVDISETEVVKPIEPPLVEKEDALKEKSLSDQDIVAIASTKDDSLVQEKETTPLEKKTQKGVKKQPIKKGKIPPTREKVSSQRKTQVNVGKKVIPRKTESLKPDQITSAKEDVNQKDKEVQSDVNAIQPEPVAADVSHDEIKPLSPNLDNVSDTNEDFFIDINNV